MLRFVVNDHKLVWIASLSLVLLACCWCGCSSEPETDAEQLRSFGWSEGTGDRFRRVALFGGREPGLEGQPLPGHIRARYGTIDFLTASGPRPLWNVGTPRNEASLYNTLEIDGRGPDPMAGWVKVRSKSPLKGNARLVLTDCHPELVRWWRDVFWDLREIRVVDEFSFELGVRKTTVLRWHLGHYERAELRGSGREFVLETDAYYLQIQSLEPLVVIPRRGSNTEAHPPEFRWHTVLEIEPASDRAQHKIITRWVLK